jgi:hypothetical protein
LSEGETAIPISSVLWLVEQQEEAMTAAAANEINALYFISNLFLFH